MFRLVVQESRYTPTSGKVVAQLGSFDPHTKSATVDTEKASFYLTNGAQPSGRAALLLQKEGVELPKWVKLASAKNGTVRHADKLRKNKPAEPKTETPADTNATNSEPADAPETVTGTVES